MHNSFVTTFTVPPTLFNNIMTSDSSSDSGNCIDTSFRFK